MRRKYAIGLWGLLLVSPLSACITTAKVNDAASCAKETERAVSDASDIVGSLSTDSHFVTFTKATLWGDCMTRKGYRCSQKNEIPDDCFKQGDSTGVGNPFRP